MERYRALESTSSRSAEPPARAFEISALSGAGCRELTYAIADFLDSLGPVEDSAASGSLASTDAPPAGVTVEREQ
jgi:hypothetical protein